MINKKYVAPLVLLTAFALNGIPVIASAATSTITATQVADKVKVTWSIGKDKVASQKLILSDANGLVKEISLSKSQRTISLAGLQLEKLYKVTLKTKKVDRTLSTSFALEPLIPLIDLDKIIGGESIRVIWKIDEKYDNFVDGYLLTAKTANMPAITVKLSKFYTGYNLQNVSKNRTYTITVKALSAAGYGTPSETTLSPLTPGAPVITASQLSPTSVKLLWSYSGAEPTNQVIRIDSIEGLARDGEDLAIAGNLREYIIDNLSVSSTYRFRIYGENSHGAGPLSAPVDQVLQLPTQSPLNFTAVAGSASESTIATLKWNAPTYSKNIAAYRIDYRKSTETTWGRLVELPNTAVSYEIASLTPGLLYIFRIQSISALGESVWLETQISTSTLPSAPSAPTLQALEGGFNASWLTPVSTGAITSYIVEYSNVIGTTSTQVEVTAGLLSKVISGIASGSYAVRVAAKTAAGLGAFSPYAYTQTFSKSTAPSAVTANAGTLTNLGKIIVSWQAPSDTGNLPILNYILQYNSAGTWVNYASLPANTTTATVTGLTTGLRYSFRVAALTSAGQSAFSDGGASASVLGLPAAPTSLAVTVTNTNSILLASLSWIAPTNTGGSAITGYSVTVTYQGTSTQKPSQGVATLTEPFFLAQSSVTGVYTFSVKAITEIGVGTEVATTTYTVI